jgi:hypothetical protein
LPTTGAASGNAAAIRTVDFVSGDALSAFVDVPSEGSPTSSFGSSAKIVADREGAATGRGEAGDAVNRDWLAIARACDRSARSASFAVSRGSSDAEPFASHPNSASNRARPRRRSAHARVGALRAASPNRALWAEHA